MKIEYVDIKNIRFEDVREYIALLPDERREKTARYRFEADKLRSLTAGLLIRKVIGDSRIVYGEHEKPYAENSDVFFSVSHSGDIVAIAYDSAELGLDVEKIPDETRLKIADRFYHPNERAYVNSAVDKTKAFSEIWTRKEAFLKCTGEGISTDLTAFDTTSEPLSLRLYSTFIGDYSLSVCSQKEITGSGIYISESELKSLV